MIAADVAARLGHLGTLNRIAEALMYRRRIIREAGGFTFYEFDDGSVLVVWHDDQRGWVWAALPFVEFWGDVYRLFGVSVHE